MPVEDSTSEISEYQFEFHGRAGEYFGIWIVNLLLSIVTVGIYSAWAKVRTNRYFYGNTIVAGSAFDYTADPRKILTGRVIAVAMLVTYQVCILFFPLIADYVLIAFLLVLPVIYLASLSFRMRYSEWRGICFGFERNVPVAYLLFLPFILYAVFVYFGPYFFGISPEDLLNTEELTEELERAIVSYFSFVAVVVLSALALFPLWQRYYYSFVGNRVDYGRSGFTLGITTRQFYRLYLGVIGLMIVGLIVASILLTVVGLIFFPEVGEGQVGELVWGFVLATYAIFLIPYVLVFAYLRTRLTNLLYSNIRLEDVQFESTLEFRRVFSLYITNALAIIVTLGLAIPWAKIRVARYRAERMTMRAVNLDGFVARTQAEVDASADAMSDIFDFDIGL